MSGPPKKQPTRSRRIKNRDGIGPNNILTVNNMKLESLDADFKYYYPVKGVIVDVIAVDNPNNSTVATRYPQQAGTKRYDYNDNYLKTTPPGAINKGFALQATVKVIEPHGMFNKPLPNVPICIGFGGVHNYATMVPSGITNTANKDLTGKEDGDQVLVQFIGGSIYNPVITHIYPHDANYIDGPVGVEGKLLFARVNGTQFTINNSGDVKLDARNAGAPRALSPKTGVINDSEIGNAVNGQIQFLTSSDIRIEAGVRSFGVDDQVIPLGNLLLQSEKDLTILSKKKTIDIDAQEDLVNVQGERGSLRRVARQYDKVKLTEGNEGSLFTYIRKLHGALSAMGKVLEEAQDPLVKAAGVIITSLIDVESPPTSQEGTIIEGSDYCMIAGVGGGADVGEDEKGIPGGHTPEDLLAIQVECLITSALAEKIKSINPNPKDEIIASVASSLKSLEDGLREAGVAVLPDIIDKATPIVVDALNQFLSGDLASLKDVPDKIQGVAVSELAEPLQDLVNFDTAIEVLTIVREVGVGELDPEEKTFYDTNYLCVNPATGAPYTQSELIELRDNDPEHDPLNQPADDGTFANLFCLLNLKNDAGKIFASPSKILGKLAEIAASYISPAAAQYTAMANTVAQAINAAQATPPDLEALYAIATDLAGGSIEESANECMDKKL